GPRIVWTRAPTGHPSRESGGREVTTNLSGSTDQRTRKSGTHREPHTQRKEGRMRRITTAISAAALSVSMALGMNLGVTQAATPGYDSAYQFESAFLTLKTGDSGTFSVLFANTGTTSWVAGTGTQVNLAVCAADKVTCNVTSAQAAWASGWLS